LFALSVLLLSSQIGLRAQESGQALPTSRVSPGTLSESDRRVIFDSAAFTGEGVALPQWVNGYLVSRVVETFQADVPNVRLYDQSGKQVLTAAIWFPGSLRVLIYSATATSDGKIIAAGKAENVDGTAGPFIALTDRSGKVTNVIQTSGFFPVNICQAPDGTVWSFGGTGYDDHSQPKPGDTLRQFDFQRGQIGSYLPLSTFPEHRHPGPAILAYLRCSTHEVVAYSGSTQEYVEMKYGGEAPHVYHVDNPPDLRLHGFATTGSKKAYGYFSRAGKGGLYYLSFDEAASIVEWLPVAGTDGAQTNTGAIIGLWGSDGNKLLVSRAEDTAGEAALHWATLVY
jgi:hypothetical protein